MASARAWIVTAVLLACLLAGPTDSWFRRRRRRRCPAYNTALPGAINNWDRPFKFQCPGPNQVISRIQSVHCDTTEDRVWRFECKSVPGLSNFQEHFWTPWVNDYDGQMGFTCPFNSLVTGFESKHSNSQEDRRWMVRCSKTAGMVTYNNVLTPYQNEWDKPMDYSATFGYFLRGIHGYHDNSKNDRRYKFDVCRIQV
ncbi:hemagglutinin/amebocyte aggregation factor-like [Branchiostoma lanceolatum]|uniref:hemagglutinin/amebocyte aggregation factor-like n=1 Tax=Branchiostoma lanceolatum TaxID=7740 RepID=UPI003451ED4E